MSTKRKTYTFNVTIKKRERTEYDEKILNNALDAYIAKLLEIESSEKKLTDNS